MHSSLELQVVKLNCGVTFAMFAGEKVAKRCRGERFFKTEHLCDNDTIIEVLSVVVGYSGSDQCQYEDSTCTNQLSTLNPLNYQYYVNGCNGGQSCKDIDVVQEGLVCQGKHNYTDYVKIHYRCYPGEYL